MDCKAAKALVLLNGEPKTLRIETIHSIPSGGYRVQFKQRKKWYNYNRDSVVWLENPKQINPEECKIYQGRQRLNDAVEVLEFTYEHRKWWRIRYKGGYESEYSDQQISVNVNCLSHPSCKSIWDYLHSVATTNTLGQENGEHGILEHIYETIEFIDDHTAAACYLDPAHYKPQNLHHGRLIFPFGCNASQKQAVAEAFGRQISVIQGPPGTGKTQTILNIISNIVSQNKTVLVVSNNNSAIANIREKLSDYKVDFIVAPLGKKDNKDLFIANQPSLPADLPSWELSALEERMAKEELAKSLSKLDRLYHLQGLLAKCREERDTVELEWKHFCQTHGDDRKSTGRKKIQAKYIIRLWLHCQRISESPNASSTQFLSNWTLRLRLWVIKAVCRHGLRLRWGNDENNLSQLIKELQRLYYPTRLQELDAEIRQHREALEQEGIQQLSKVLTEQSLKLFRHSLYKKYKDGRPNLVNLMDKHFGEQYPVVLSTTFSACNCTLEPNGYDYLVMDEASQVSIETGALALTCARNAVIVGDTMQLPNVVTYADRARMETIQTQFGVSDAYDCGKTSFLQSLCNVVKDAPKTLLREHYRCHPRIINFCNQKFYGGNLQIMTEDRGEENVLCVIKTAQGNHAVNQYNQREIDVISQEVLPHLANFHSIGIITPYNHQVRKLTQQLPKLDAATVHKYQGRERDVIIMSVVDNQITDFADDANLLNVAVSRAKSKFCLVVTGNPQNSHRNITDLIEYADYNNCTVTDSKIVSIFDYLYEQYTDERLAFLGKHPKVSEFASENLTYMIIHEILSSDMCFSCYKVLCHFPLRQIICDTSLLDEEEATYASHENTHIDFLIVSRVSKKPVLAIETDGYSYHNENTEQYQRDQKKDHILKLYGLPLLRLSTKGSNEKERITTALRRTLTSCPPDFSA